MEVALFLPPPQIRALLNVDVILILLQNEKNETVFEL